MLNKIIKFLQKFASGKKEQEQKQEVKKCKMCHKEIVTNNKKKMFCNESCKKKYYYIVNKINKKYEAEYTPQN